MTDKSITITTMAKDVQINFRVTSAVERAIKAAAARDGRTVTNYVLWALIRADKGIAKAAEVK